MDGRLQGLIDALDVTNSERMLKNVLKNHALSCGFERFAYFHSSAGDKIRTLNNYPSEWEKMYLTQGFTAIDPVVAHAKRTRELFVWSVDSWRKSCVSGEVRDFLSRACEFGIRAGATIPVEGSFGAFIMLTFATSRARLERPVQGDGLRAQRAALAVHYRLESVAEFPKISEGLRLSAKETICLKWAERGSTMHEIASLTGIQYRTVQHYLDSARRKLRARNVTQAVAVAKDYGLLGRSPLVRRKT